MKELLLRFMMQCTLNSGRISHSVFSRHSASRMRWHRFFLSVPLFPRKKKENWCWTVWILVLTKLRNKSLGWTQWFKQRKLKVEWFSNRATFLYVSSLVDRSGQNHRGCHLWNSPILVITTSLSKFLFNIKQSRLSPSKESCTRCLKQEQILLSVPSTIHSGNLGYWERFALKRKENVPPFALQEARYCLSMVYLKSTNLTFPYVLPQPTTVTHQLAAHLSSIHRPVCGQIECHVVDSTSFPQLIRS